MAELSFKQIVDKLNEEFTGTSRKLIFWYDADAEFVEDVENLQLEHAKVIKLTKSNQFRTKYLLECEDKEGSYLIYAPFAQPAARDNHLIDTIKYSRTFSADRSTLICNNLGMDPRCLPVLNFYKKFFKSEARTQKFADLELDAYNKKLIETGIMSVICKSKTASFEEVLRCMLTDEGLTDNKYLEEFENYNLTKAFWEHCEDNFGYNDSQPTLQRLAMSMFATYAARTLRCDAPKAWEQYMAYKSGNVVAFLDNLMNSYIYGGKFDAISREVYGLLDAENYLGKMAADDIVDCNLFAGVDRAVCKWIIERLEAEDTDAKLNGKSIPEICKARRKMHFGRQFHSEYFVLENAYYIIAAGGYSPAHSLELAVRNYLKEGNEIDRRYRYFYYYYDQLEDTGCFEKLRELVENIYTNEHLNKSVINWTELFTEEEGNTGLKKQTDFYNNFVLTSKDKVVVIISDALRYEVGVTLAEKFKSDEKCNTSLTAIQGILPSITSFGMAALLPHSRITVTETEDILLDDMPTVSLKNREAILNKYLPNSRCVQFDEIKSLKQADLRDIFNGQDTVYIYHNQVDARGDKPASENEVFTACEEAVEEVYGLVKKLASLANIYHFIITADHGFIYKRDKLDASDKIKGVANASKRFCISDDEIKTDGVMSMPYEKILAGQDGKYISFPKGSDLFTVPGSGLNYVHGGCSPQEMVVPVIDVRTERGKKDTVPAKIDLVSLTHKITNLSTNLDFVQTEPVSDIVKEAIYKVFFISDDGEKISNEILCNADRKDRDTANRIFRLRFSFKNKKYDKHNKYYLVAVDSATGLEILRHEVLMDIAFADDFGFDL